jgi:hypothetical protein
LLGEGVRMQSAQSTKGVTITRNAFFVAVGRGGVWNGYQ